MKFSSFTNLAVDLSRPVGGVPWTSETKGVVSMPRGIQNNAAMSKIVVKGQMNQKSWVRDVGYHANPVKSCWRAGSRYKRGQVTGAGDIIGYRIPYAARQIACHFHL